ncbi:BamA/TamA family outer membrane protein [Sediminitomix flava]|uniref:Surface antigen-like protein n=1 Tax=Sediminitomix flava TaxID=379075 RepID=A0A315ZFH1_SEDFL|nr:BamA/TamA family outer membrane protein [Sediminitomix flava]PWJ44251.1 surface antigen-like protein [Sediminitomix flava]
MKLSSLIPILCLLSSVVFAQEDDEVDYSKRPKFDAIKERSKMKYRLIPTPSYSPSVEWGLNLVNLFTFYMNKTDTITPPSTVAVIGMGTTNSSWAVGAVPRIYLKEDKWRIFVDFGYAEIRQELDLAPIGKARVIRNNLVAKFIVKRRIIPKLFGGFGYAFSSVEYEGRDDESSEKLVMAGFENRVENHGLQYALNYDTRDNIFYPYHGMYAEYTLGQNFSQEGEDNGYLSHNIDFRQFFSIKGNPDHVLAWHFLGRFLSGNPTNENYGFYGRSGILTQRGYQVGSFIDRHLVTAEAEYRRETPLLKRRLGFVAFAGVGKVYGDYENFGDAEWLPDGGVGVRYRILPYERLNVRVDFSVGKEGFVWYFGLREAF